MPLLYTIPDALQAAINNGSASLIGAVIKDGATGKVLGHVQQSGIASELLNNVAGVAMAGFSPLKVVSVLQNEQIKRRIDSLQEGMMLVQGLQYGSLALSGLNLGVSVAGFALMDARLRGIQKHLEKIDDAIDQVTSDRRDDEVRCSLSEIGTCLRNVDSLLSREDPASMARSMQIELERHAGKLEVHFRREAQTDDRGALTLVDLDRLWTLAAAMRLCQEASLQALFVSGDLRTVEPMGGRIYRINSRCWRWSALTHWLDWLRGAILP